MIQSQNTKPKLYIFMSFINSFGSLKNTVEVSEIGERRTADGKAFFSTKNILSRDFSKNQ